MTTTAEYLLENDEYFNPQLVLANDRDKEAKLRNILDVFKLPTNQIERIRKIVAQELKYGLEYNPARPSVFPMFNTFVTKFPTGQEVGEFLAIDIGGTNLRILKYNAHTNENTGQVETKLVSENYNITSEHRQSNGKKFFGFLAKCVKDFVEKKFSVLPQDGNRIGLGFTFSFGYDQLAINKGKVTMFGIGTNLPDVIGKDPVSLFQQSLDALNVPVEVVAIANDVTATLITGKLQDGQTRIAFILGSGTNIGYVEKVANFGRIINPLKTFGFQPEEVAINTEFCVLGDDGCLDFCKNRYDFSLDKSSLFPREYTYEKVLGGAFLGELLRLVVVDLVQQNLLLGGELKPALAQKGALLTADISRIEGEADSFRSKQQPCPYEQVYNLFTGFGYTLPQISPECCATIVYVCELISVRAALFCAIPLAVFVDYLPEKRMKVCVDGSVYKKHPRMATLIDGFLKVLCPSKTCTSFLVDGGSLVGAAMLAAAYSKPRSN